MTVPDEPPRRPGVYSRLADEAEVRWAPRTPPRSARWVGWALCIALVAGVVFAAARVGLW